MNLFFDADHAASHRELASRLRRCASGNQPAAHLAQKVSDAYGTALRSHGQGEDAWREFATSLDRFVAVAHGPSDDMRVLRSILRENGDLVSDTRIRASA